MRAALFVGFVALALLQVTWMPHIRPFGVMPDIVLVALSTWALLLGGTTLVPIAALSGLVLDLGSGAPLGLSAVALLIALLVIGWWKHAVLYGGVGLYIVAAAVATLAYDGSILIGMQTLHESVDWPSAMAWVIAPSLIVNGLLAIPAAYVCGSLARRMRLVATFPG
jgi:rod shape-determining protein MreD